MRSKALILILLGLLVTLALAPALASPSQKLDVLLHPLLQRPQPEPIQVESILRARGIAHSVTAAGPRIGLVLKATDDASASDLADRVISLGGSVGSRFGRFVTARVPVSALDSLAAVDSLSYAEAARVVKPSLKKSIPASKGDLANWGILLSRRYDGTGVVVGDVDTGIDWTHGDFRNDDGTTRLVSLWDQAEAGAPPAGFSYGTEFTQSEINAKLAGNPSIWDTGLDQEGHGTHVMSIAAGNGRCGAGVCGVAPRASIVFTKVSSGYDFGIDKMLDGVNYIFEKAESLGMPAVVNLSLGFNTGGHDGTSIACQAIDALTGPGRIIVNSAGNSAYYDDGYGNKYFEHVGFEANDQEQKFAAYIISYYSDEGSIELWYEPPGDIEVAVGAIDIWYGGTVEHGQFVAPGDSVSGSVLMDAGSEIATYDIDATETSNPNNGARHVIITIRPDSWLSLFYEWTITVKGNCYFDAWAGEESYMLFLDEQIGVVGGDSRSSIAYPAYAKQVISVGSYVTRNEWYDVFGQQQYDSDAQLGAISYFSSQGPSRRPDLTGPKPEIAAPGQYIAAAFSAQTYAMGPSYYYPQYAVHDYYYYVNAGTSMSSPHVAGAVALLLQRSSGLTPDDVEQILAQSAATDSFTGEVHNDIYGYGKLDVQAALKVVDPGSANDLGLDVQADYPVYQRGDTLELFAQAAHVGPGLNVDFGVAIARPDGMLLFYPFWTSDYTMMNLYLPADFTARDFLLYTCNVQSGSTPISTGGNYIVFAAFADPKTGAFLGNLSASTFEIDI